jgi:hypothetical protein
MAKRKTHAHRVMNEDRSAVCECGEEFDTDDLWRAHYEKNHDEKERARLEGRDPAVERESAKLAERVHKQMLAARDNGFKPAKSR